MCGISGKISINGSIDQNDFIRSLDVIRHRGPDDQGYWFDSDAKIGLGSRRLAIQDLSANGHMPMHSSDGRYVIVYNGEIYNHLEVRENLMRLGYKFLSRSDTETVLYAYIAWGSKALDRFSGMFAIAIYDRMEQQLFLARDRVGEKPLHYWHHEGGISFSSELKQLLKDEKLPRKINKRALKQYLEDGFLKSGETFIQSVYKLPPAHYLLYDVKKNHFEIQAYWALPEKRNQIASGDELLEKLDGLMLSAVKQQLISDVPLGILLSGGVDSSLVTSYAVEHATEKVKTFHISFEGFGKYNEAEYARQVAGYFGTEHIELSGNEIGYEMIDEMLNYYDEPLGDSSMLPTYLVSQLTKKHVTVALGGDGGDELFGGYTTYRSLLAQRNSLEKVPQFLRKAMAEAASFLPVGFKGRNFLKNLPGSGLERFGHNRLFDANSINKIITPEWRSQFKKISSKPILENSGQMVYDMGRYDFKYYLPEDVLIKVDRASMAHSLEMRAPFLDRNLIEFAFSEVPDHMKATETGLKILPKKLLKKRMPVDFDVDRKQGFSIPLNDWIANKWYNNFYDDIQYSLPEFLNKEFILKMFKNVKKGYTNSSRLFALVLLSKWIKKFKIKY